MNIEHYFNNTDPRPAEGRATAKPVVMIAATVSRAGATAGTVGEWRVTRMGELRRPLTVKYQVSGDATPGRDFVPLKGSVVIPAGERSATIVVRPLSSASDDRVVVVRLRTGERDYLTGCPAQSLVVIRR